MCVEFLLEKESFVEIWMNLNSEMDVLYYPGNYKQTAFWI